MPTISIHPNILNWVFKIVLYERNLKNVIYDLKFGNRSYILELFSEMQSMNQPFYSYSTTVYRVYTKFLVQKSSVHKFIYTNVHDSPANAYSMSQRAQNLHNSPAITSYNAYDPECLEPP